MKKYVAILLGLCILPLVSCQTNYSEFQDGPEEAQPSINNEIKYAVLTYNDENADNYWTLRIPADERDGFRILKWGELLDDDAEDWTWYSFKSSSINLEYDLIYEMGLGGWELVTIRREIMNANYIKYYFKKNK